MKKNLKSGAGFTLLELLVVFSVIGVLIGVGSVSFLSYNNKQSIETAATELKTGIENAKFNAVSRVKPSGCAALPLNKYSFVACTNKVPQVNNCTDPANLYEIRAVCNTSVITTTTKKRPADITVSISATECGNPRILEFYPLKNGTDVPFCRIVLENGDSSLVKTLCVDMGGNVSVNDGDTICP